MKTTCALIVLLSLSLNIRAAVTDWFVVLDETNGFYASPGVPEAAITALKEAQSDSASVRTFTFTPSGNWVALSGDRFWTDDDNLPASQKLAEMQQHKDDTKCLAVAPTGLWTIFWNWNGFWIPGAGPAWNKVCEVAGSRQEIRSVADGPDDSWVLLYGKTSIGYGGVPSSLAKVLDNAVSNSIAIQCVAFRGRDWICLAHDEWWTSDTNLPAAKFVEQSFKSGQHPKWIAFVPYLPSFDAAVAHHLERKLRRRVQVSYTMTFSSPETRDGIYKQYALLPPDTEMQKLVACHISCQEAPKLPEYLVADENDSTRFDKMIIVPLANGLLARPIHLEISYIVDLFDLRLREGADDSGLAIAKPTVFDTRATKCIDYNSPVFQEYLREQKLIRAADESNLAFAYRAYRTLCADLTKRVKTGAPDSASNWQASYQCRGQCGGCGNCSMQFVAILRANRVPARMVVGRWAKNQDGDYGQWHVKTDFYDPAVGWIPVDPTFGFFSCRDGNNPDPNFGNYGADFITMHLNTEVHPWHSYFEMPLHQFGVGRYEGSSPFHPEAAPENWSVKRLPLQQTNPAEKTNKGQL